MQDPVFPFTKSFLRFALYVFILLPASCTPAIPAATHEPIHIQYSFAAQPWLGKVSDCADGNIVTAELRAADFQDFQSADMVIRIEQPDNLTSNAYQIGTDDLLIIVNPQNPIKKLTFDQVRGLFTGWIQNWKGVKGSEAPVQAWVFPAGEDVQQIFEQTVLDGSPVTSAARLANSPDEMSQAVEKDINAIGIITRHWNTENVSDVITVANSLPVLAITLSKPQGTLAHILACMQK
jgi:hypothetical protein